MKMKKDDIIDIARIADRLGLVDVVKEFDKKIEKIDEEENVIRIKDMYGGWLKGSGKTRVSIIEFKKEIGVTDADLVRDSRMIYLEKQIQDAFETLTELENDKKTSKMFLFDKELQNVKRIYKKMYIEYATLKGDMVQQDRINDDIIQSCREVPIETLVSSGEIINAGRGRKVVCCPFHNEKTPSFYIFPDNSAHCFGCGAHFNNSIDFIIRMNDVNFYDAVQYLQNYI